MKKLFMLSFLAFSTLSFASNGQFDLKETEFKKVNTEQTNSNDAILFAPTATYEIKIKITICGGEYGTSYYVTANPQTTCLSDVQLTSTLALYEQLYQGMHPDACNITAFAYELDECLP